MADSTPLVRSGGSTPRSNPQTFNPITTASWAEPMPSRSRSTSSRSPQVTGEITSLRSDYPYTDSPELHEMGHREPSRGSLEVPTPTYSPYLSDGHPSEPPSGHLYPSLYQQESSQSQSYISPPPSMPYFSPPSQPYPCPPSPSRAPYPIHDRQAQLDSRGSPHLGGRPMHPVTSPYADRPSQYEGIDYGASVNHSMNDEKDQHQVLHSVTSSRRRRILMCRVCFAVVILAIILGVLFGVVLKKKDDPHQENKAPDSSSSSSSSITTIATSPTTNSPVTTNPVTPQPPPPVVTTPVTIATTTTTTSTAGPTSAPGPSPSNPSGGAGCLKQCNAAFNSCIDACTAENKSCEAGCGDDLACQVSCGFKTSSCRTPCHSASSSCIIAC
ncbi:hypothetical protein B0O80DRAFT_503585 [Mortierella sp. GBAus27b]|nr:hypothetical protein B0O80DRAFT_503585 [Mortierella sp. GBAus27b]